MTGQPVAPDEVQLGGIGAPQAHWLGLIDCGITVTSVPECRGPDQPRVVLGMFNDGRILTHDQARDLVRSVLSAIGWTPALADESPARLVEGHPNPLSQDGAS